MTPYYESNGITLYHGDCLTILPSLTADSVGAVVTDPPYDLTAVSRNGSSRVAGTGSYGRHTIGTKTAGFMGKEWDGTGVAFRPETWAEVLRVMKPGAYLLAFGGTRTYHRMACAIEDAGFEIRDSLHWIHATGFPKSLRVGEGCGTALKPAHEPILLARKPLSESTVAANVARWGTGALNIDAGRIPGAPRTSHSEGNIRTCTNDGWGMKPGNFGAPTGRFPANLIFSHAAGCVPTGTRRVQSGGGPNGSKPGLILGLGLNTQRSANYADATGREEVETWQCAPSCPVAELDRQSGERASGARGPQHRERGNQSNSMAGGPLRGGVCEASTGGASRFFLCLEPETPFLFVPKPSRSERDSGCEDLINKSKHVPSDKINQEESQWESMDQNQDIPRELDTQPPRGTTESLSGILSQNHPDQCSPTSRSGKMQTDLFRSDGTSITGMGIDKITDSKTSNFAIEPLTSGSTVAANCETASGGSHVASAANSSPLTRSAGTFPEKDTLYTGDAESVTSGKSSQIRYDAEQIEKEAPNSNVGKNRHPTVKPVALIEYLLKLTVPPGETVLDCFAGSGTTGVAAKRLQVPVVLIEREEEYCEIAAARIGGDTGRKRKPRTEVSPVQPSLFEESPCP